MHENFVLNWKQNYKSNLEFSGINFPPTVLLKIVFNFIFVYSLKEENEERARVTIILFWLNKKF